MQDARAAIRNLRAIPRAEPTIATPTTEYVCEARCASKAALTRLDRLIDAPGAS